MTTDRGRREILAVVNLKGGTSKTTTAVYLAHALHERGRRVLLIDADPQGSALSWNEDTPEPFPFPVFGLPTRELHRQLMDAVSPDIDAIVIDTPPLDQKSGIVVSALRAATLVIVPVAPSPIEYKRLAQVAETVSDAADFRPDGQAAPLAVLLTRTVPNASSTDVWREQIRAEGFWCLDAEVRRLERFAQAYGENITDAAQTAYGVAVDELMAGEKEKVS
jgi:chromosome partitioning protein